MAYQMLEHQQAIASLTQKTETVQESSELGARQHDQNFSQDDNVISKKKSRKTRSKTSYSPTKIKARNYLTNIAYRRVNEKDLKDGSFFTDLLCYLTMDLKPFFLNSTYFEDKSREMILMLWNECLPANYLNCLKNPENFELLHNPKLTFKAKDLLKHLPYLANLKDPIFQNKVEDLIKNREDLQKYLLATENLNKTIEESLEIAVGHAKINDESAVRHVSDRDDPLYKFFKENDNPLDVVYRKQAKFDVQNPIIGSLLQQINKSKLPGYEETKNILDKGPDPNVFDLEDRFNKLFDRERPGQKGLVDKYFDNNDNDDDDDSPPGSPGVPPAPNSQNFNLSSQPPPLEDDDDDPLIKPVHQNYFPFNWKIPGREYVDYDADYDADFKRSFS